MIERFEVEFLPEAVQFINELDEKAREKVYYNIRKSQFINDNDLFKKITENIWEFRTFYNGVSFRIFAFWDKSKTKQTLVLATHGIFKKTNKTPKKEIEKAENIRRQFLNQQK